MRLAAVFLFAFSASAAVISGVVVEDETGYPLAGSQISLIPLPGSIAKIITTRSGRTGTFTFNGAITGWYVLIAAREGFADYQAGQLRADRPGVPFEVKTEGRSYFQIRMGRKASIAGKVLDRNNVGVPDWPVQIYTAHRPIRRVTSGLTDDRGSFRIGLLSAGSYLVRSGGGSLEDGSGLLPSYFPFGTSPETAEPVRVRSGETHGDVTIRVSKGHLLEVNGIFSSPVQARLNLITPAGREVIASVSPPAGFVPFTVKDIPPGPAELIADGTQCGGYVSLDLERDVAGLRVGCANLSAPSFEWSPGLPFPLMIRRIDLDQTGPEHIFRDREQLIPGRYEVMPQTGPDCYVESVENGASAEGWFGVSVTGSPKIHITVSAHPAAIEGKVSSGGHPAAGAAVYLERIDLPQQWFRRADSAGHYRFDGLTPGAYRTLSSFDYDPEDRRPMNAAPVITLREGDQATQDMEMILP